MNGAVRRTCWAQCSSIGVVVVCRASIDGGSPAVRVRTYVF